MVCNRHVCEQYATTHSDIVVNNNKIANTEHTSTVLDVDTNYTPIDVLIHHVSSTIVVLDNRVRRVEK